MRINLRNYDKLFSAKKKPPVYFPAAQIEEGNFSEEKENFYLGVPIKFKSEISSLTAMTCGENRYSLAKTLMT